MLLGVSGGGGLLWLGFGATACLWYDRMLVHEVFRLPSWFIAGLFEYEFGCVVRTDVSSPWLNPWLRPRYDLALWFDALASRAPLV